MDSAPGEVAFSASGPSPAGVRARVEMRLRARPSHADEMDAAEPERGMERRRERPRRGKLEVLSMDPEVDARDAVSNAVVSGRDVAIGSSGTEVRTYKDQDMWNGEIVRETRT